MPVGVFKSQQLAVWLFSDVADDLHIFAFCIVLILVDCVLKKSCYRLSINVKKTDNPFLILK